MRDEPGGTPMAGVIYRLFTAARLGSGPAPLLEWGDTTMTYDDVDQHVRRLASELVNVGCRPGHRVAVVADDSPRIAIAAIALSAIGACFVAVSDGHEAQRRAHGLGLFGVLEPCSESQEPRVHALSGQAVREPGSAYLIMTSGSTSTPKTVPISDLSLASYAEHLRDRYVDISRARIGVNFQATFDAYFEILLLALLNGGTLVFPQGREHIVAADFVNRHSITVWDGVPSHAEIAARIRPNTSMPSLRVVIFGGETLSAKLARKWMQLAPNATIFNTYGPSEATIVALDYQLPRYIPDSWTSIPLGRPVKGMEVTYCSGGANARGHVELLLRGVQVFSGYIAYGSGSTVDLRSRKTSGGWYRTGDLVVCRDGELFFHGRRDRIVKLMGKRVDLDAVALSLKTAAGEREVEVFALEDRIVAAVEAPDGVFDDTLDSGIHGLRPYAQPREYIWFREFPRLSSGKVDRVRLEGTVKGRLCKGGRRKEGRPE